jgi:hypothetical protein
MIERVLGEVVFCVVFSRRLCVKLGGSLCENLTPQQAALARHRSIFQPRMPTNEQCNKIYHLPDQR